eukprot:3495382-Pleurochrysis_carterae.AAC.2
MASVAEAIVRLGSGRNEEESICSSRYCCTTIVVSSEKDYLLKFTSLQISRDDALRGYFDNPIVSRTTRTMLTYVFKFISCDEMIKDLEKRQSGRAEGRLL